jgi:hypothetical protein
MTPLITVVEVDNQITGRRKKIAVPFPRALLFRRVETCLTSDGLCLTRLRKVLNELDHDFGPLLWIDPMQEVFYEACATIDTRSGAINIFIYEVCPALADFPDVLSDEEDDL